MGDSKIELSRRQLLKTATAAGVALAVGQAAIRSSRAVASGENEGPFTLPPLPYKDDALDPAISSKTLQLHHGKHHKTYVDKLNGLVKGTKYAQMDLEKLVVEAAKDPKDKKIFNNGAQAWNHTFYWNSLKPGGGGKPAGKLLAKVDSDLGGADELKKKLSTAIGDLFGSGWVWLILDGDKLAIASTSNADNPLTSGQKPLLTIDVWEHAYYVDYQNRRAEYAAAVLDKLVNWEFAEKNLG